MGDLRAATQSRNGTVVPPAVDDTTAARGRRRERRDAGDCECHAVGARCASALPAQKEGDPDQHRRGQPAASQEPVPEAVRIGLGQTQPRRRFDRVLQRRGILAPEVPVRLFRRQLAICRGPEGDQFLERSNPIAGEMQDDAALDRVFSISRYLAIVCSQPSLPAGRCRPPDWILYWLQLASIGENDSWMRMNF
jgi:hypothetical protein